MCNIPSPVTGLFLFLSSVLLLNKHNGATNMTAIEWLLACQALTLVIMLVKVIKSLKCRNCEYRQEALGRLKNGK